MQRAIEFRYLVIAILSLIVLTIVIAFISKASGHTLPSLIKLGNHSANQSEIAQTEFKKDLCEIYLQNKNCDAYNSMGCKKLLGKDCNP